MKYIGIVGSRRRDGDEDYKAVLSAFLEIYEDGDIIVSGGCPKGGDRFAEMIAKHCDIPIIIFYPDKKLLPPNPKRWDFAKMNYARNIDIAKKSDHIIACVAADRKGGTEHTIKEYLKLGKKHLKLV